MSAEHESQENASSQEEAPRVLPKVIKAADVPAISALFKRPQIPRVLKANALERVASVVDAVNQAQSQASQVVQDAQNSATQITQDAYEKGHAQGLAQGLSKVMEMQHHYESKLAKSEQEMVALALQIAERIARHKLQVEPLVLQQMVDASLELVQNRARIKLLVHPDNLEQVTAWQERLQARVTGSLSVEPSEQVEHGGCVIETEAGMVDATLGTQLAAIEEALLGSS